MATRNDVAEALARVYGGKRKVVLSSGAISGYGHAGSAWGSNSPNREFEGIGPELWPQPSFGSATDLSLGAGWSVSSGRAFKDAGTASMMQSTAAAPTPGVLYRVRFTLVTYGGSGTVNANIGNNEQVYRSVVGSYEELIRATTAGLPLIFGSVTFSGSVDDVSFRAVPG